MSAIKIILFFILLSSVSAIQAQKNYLLKFGPTLLGLSDGDRDRDNGAYAGAGLSLEHALSRKTSLLLNISWNARQHILHAGRNGDYNVLYSKTNIEPEFRFYTRSVTQGWYVGGSVAIHFVRAQTYTSITDPYTVNPVQLGAGVTTGYQFRLSQVMHLQIGGGFGAFLPRKNIGGSYVGYSELDASYRYQLNLLLGYDL